MAIDGLKSRLLSKFHPTVLVGLLAHPLVFTNAAHSDENWITKKYYQTNVSQTTVSRLCDAKPTL